MEIFFVEYLMFLFSFTASFEGKSKMYLANELMYDCFNKEEFNNFQFWREPVMELTLDDFELCEVDVKDEPFISTQYDSFLYWRDPIPDLEEL